MQLQKSKLLLFNDSGNYSVLFLLQAIVTPLSEHLLGWREIENSIAYCLIALEVKLSLFLFSSNSCNFSGVESENLYEAV